MIEVFMGCIEARSRMHCRTINSGNQEEEGEHRSSPFLGVNLEDELRPGRGPLQRTTELRALPKLNLRHR